MNRMFPYRPISLIVGGVLACSLAGCSPQDKPRSYRVPKEKAAEPAPGMGAMPPAAPPARVGPGLAYDTPEGWTSGKAGGMRKAAFVVQDGERKVDITAIDLAASAGTLLPNVNRWREQIQLGEITQTELDEAASPISVAGVAGQYVELVGPEDADPRQAILGVVAIRGGQAWFFKLWGDADLALREKERFQAFVESIKFSTTDGAQNDD